MERRSILHGGHFALGFLVAFLMMIILFLILDVYEGDLSKDSGFVGAILGAIIGGAIALLGQVFVIIQSERKERIQEQSRELAMLQVLMTRLLRCISVFAQVREHAESNDPKDVIVAGHLPKLMKPMKVNDVPGTFSEAELALPLTMSDRKFFNLMNVLDSILANFRWVHVEYESRVYVFLDKVKNSGQFKFLLGGLAGEASLILPEHYELNDLQEHYWDSTYSGLVVSKMILEIIIAHLSTRHGKTLSVSTKYTEEDWERLFDMVEIGHFDQDLSPEMNPS